ncbi:TetR/AcrR family transcriptional regulator [Cohnella sp.]|uniref:TetR/AcrR family transcriptional regulator n=1 Tax=Cohnella sp. TaxID=1883426 RepID=UPI003562A1C5
MTTTNRKRPSNRDVVIRVATALFLEKGYQITSMDEIVAASKVSKTNIYYHFKSKEELLSAIVEGIVAHYDRLIGETVGQTQLSATERIERFAALLTDNQTDSLGGCPFLTLYVQTSREQEWVREEIGRFFRKQIGAVEHLLREGVAREEFNSRLPVPQTAALIVSAIEGALFLQHTRQDSTLLSDTLHTLANLLK